MELSDHPAKPVGGTKCGARAGKTRSAEWFVGLIRDVRFRTPGPTSGPLFLHGENFMKPTVTTILRTSLFVLTSVFIARTAGAADWPAWRGPAGQGLSDEKGL